MKQSNGKIFVVGLTGNIGSGKSSISNILKEKQIPVIDADIISREVIVKHPNIIEEIKVNFGGDYFHSDGTLLRKKLGNAVFSDEQKKNKLEEIIIPYIIKDIFDQVKEYDDMEVDFCVVDAPTLIENNLHFHMNAIILVTIDKELQLKRIIKRDSLNLQEALDRINSQMSQDEKLKYADFVINNNGTIEDTKAQLEEILKLLDSFRGKDGTKKELCSNHHTSCIIDNGN